jgi:valyl-tRNA synthetase
MKKNASFPRKLGASLVAPQRKSRYIQRMKLKELPQKYDHAETEARLQQQWFAQGTYHWQNDAPREQTFVVDTPPPTVSGHLHMGHVFSYVQADIIARYQRMSGKDVFYPMGFDDNGLPTERLVEKTLKKRATDYESREAFIKVCEEVSEQARKDFRELFQSLALSVDWRQEYHTISEDCRRLSQESFLDLHAKGHIERRLEPMLWDPVDQTAIAQAEIVDKELDSHFSDIYFGIEGSDEKITIATTRPELIPACVAIFYHPDDARYQHLKGKQAVTPLFGIKVPILADDTVEPDKGTGIMMCCTFGDEADIEKWRKHKLEARIIINKYGKIDFTSLRGALAEGDTAIHTNGTMDCFADARNDAFEQLQNKKTSNPDKKHLGARQIILQLLEESGDLIESRPIKHAVKCAERSGAALEIIPTHQWFVKVTDKKEALIARARESHWFPDWMRLRMEQWTEGLNWDWCISRQRYYGVPFPVWYSKREGEEGKMLFASPKQLPVNPLTDLPEGYSADEVTPDADVMDTWATSSLSPQINAGGLADGERFSKLFPADLRPQAHEIIRTWAFYTVVKSHLHNNSIPWKNLMISGWCLAEDKTKMSKSKGNVVTRTDLIAQHGTDAIRYWAATSRLGQDTAFSPDLLKIGKKLVTKLWNATKFAAIHLEKLPDDGALPPITETLDSWILARLHGAVQKSTQAFEQYEYADALRATEDFFWNDFCDNYLELVKKRSYDETGENPAGQLSAAATIYHCLQGILALFAPFVPHITEELYSHLFTDAYAQKGSLHNRNQWIKSDSYPYDKQAEASGIAAIEILEAIRKAKSEKGVSIKFPIASLTIHTAEDERLLRDTLADLAGAGNIAQIAQSGTPSSGLPTTESGRFALAITFAESAEVA